MKNKIAGLFAAIMLLSMTPAANAAKDKIRLIKEKDKLSYAIGLNIGKNFKMQSLDLSLDLLMKGIKAVLYQEDPLMTDKEVHATMELFKKRMINQMEQKQKEAADQNKKRGEEFLALNKTKRGVVTLPSGLQYKVLKEGYGRKPALSSSVVVNYKGTLLDGSEFDSSYKRGKPATFKVSGLIKGWVQALPLMRTGAKWKLFVPSELAYGERQASQLIGPNSTLIFEMELLEVKSGK